MYMSPSSCVLRQANICCLLYCVPDVISLLWYQGKLNGVDGSKRLYSQAVHLEHVTVLTAQKHQLWLCFLAGILSNSTELVLSPLFFTSCQHLNISMIHLLLFCVNRLLYSDFHPGRRARERDGISPCAESTQGDRPGTRHSVDWGLHR